MKISVDNPFISDKTAINWPTAGMEKGKNKAWLEALEKSLRENRDYDWLREALETGKKLKLKLSIHGKPRSVKLLDIHDALAGTINKITDCFFPREKRKSIPQTKDRHFWKVEAEKFINSEEKVEIEIGELEKE